MAKYKVSSTLFVQNFSLKASLSLVLKRCALGIHNTIGNEAKSIENIYSFYIFELDKLYNRRFRKGYDSVVL